MTSKNAKPSYLSVILSEAKDLRFFALRAQNDSFSTSKIKPRNF